MAFYKVIGISQPHSQLQPKISLLLSTIKAILDLLEKPQLGSNEGFSPIQEKIYNAESRMLKLLKEIQAAGLKKSLVFFLVEEYIGALKVKNKTRMGAIRDLIERHS